MDIISLNLINSASMVYDQQVYLVPFTMIKHFRLVIGHGMQMIGKGGLPISPMIVFEFINNKIWMLHFSKIFTIAL